MRSINIICKASLIAGLIPSGSEMKNKNKTALTAAYALFSGSRVSAFSPVRTSLAVTILASFLINYVSLTYSDVVSRLMQGCVAFSFITAITGTLAVKLLSGSVRFNERISLVKHVLKNKR